MTAEPNAAKKGNCILINNGKVMNKTNDGITSQNILLDNCTTCAESWVSIYNQIIAITETSGMEASIAPKNVLRLATSEIKAIKIAEITTFIML